MAYLSQKRILELHTAALELHLENDRAVLLGAMPWVLSALDTSPKPSQQLLLDLNALNSMPPSTSAEPCALENWLETAIHLHHHDPRTEALRSILKEVEQVRLSGKPLPFVSKKRRWTVWAGLGLLPLVGFLGLFAYWQWPRCGNGRVDAGESCDDGNGVSGDGCSAICARELSGVDAGVHDAGAPDADAGDAGMDADADDAGTGADTGKAVSPATAKVRVSCKPGTIKMINGSRKNDECGQPPVYAVTPKDFPKELEWKAPSSPAGADPAWMCKCDANQ